MTARPGILIIVLVGTTTLSAQVSNPAERTPRVLRAVRVTTPVVVDGNLDEPNWGQAVPGTGFTQSEPREGQPATHDTEVRILYDAESLYIGIRAFDPEPGQLIIPDLKKDFLPPDSDIVGFVLDTFHDRRNGFEFAINPLGAKWDSQSSNESERNMNWDAVWTVRTRILEDRWQAEVAIPFKTLRFSNRRDQTWGINFMRRIRRKNEDSFWSPLPRIYRLNRVSLAGTLEGLEDIQPSLNLRLKPYVVSSFGQTFPAGRRQNNTDIDGGLDIKLGIGSNFTLDGTVNTDFSQVEADEQQVNLTRFSLFFPEKRDFFLESSSTFNFGMLGELAPQRAPGQTTGRQSTSTEDIIFFFSRRIGLSDGGLEIPIGGGVRLTGRQGPWSVGLLNIQARRLGAVASTNYTAARVKRNVFRSSQIGAIYLDKRPNGTGAFNRGYGADGTLRIGQGTYFSGFYALTSSPGRRSQNDAFRVGWAFRDRRWDFRSVYTDIGNHFNAELGFVPRTGIKTHANSFAVKFRPGRTRRWLREITPTLEHQTFWTQANTVETRYMDLRLPVMFQDGSNFEIGRNGSFERLFRPFRIQSNARIQPGDYPFGEYFASYNSNRASRFSGNVRIQQGSFYGGEKTTVTAGTGVRMNSRLNGSLSYTRNDVSLAAQSFKTDLVSARINVSFSTTAFLNALLQYNTDSRQWSSNIRFNIIHRPLSDFFIVYNERRDTAGGRPLDRAVIAKFTYLFGG